MSLPENSAGKPLVVAQLGCGYWGPNLARNLVANPGCELKWVCDPSTQRRSFVSGLYPKVKVSASCEEPINDPEVEAVVIATPVATHFDLAMAALKAGKHILVEKPMAASLAEVQELRDASKARNLVAMAGHTFMYNAAVLHLKSLIDAGSLGELRYIYSQRLNLGRIRSDVDALWNFAPHDISIIQFLLGDPEPESVACTGMDYVQPGVMDVVFANIVYPGKVMAHVHVSWLDPRKIRRMTVVGSRRMAVYDDMSENKIAIYDKGIDRESQLGQTMDFDGPGIYAYTHRSGDVLLPKIDFAEPLKSEISHFVACIRDGVACRTGVDHALGVVRILDMCGTWKPAKKKDSPNG